MFLKKRLFSAAAATKGSACHLRREEEVEARRLKEGGKGRPREGGEGGEGAKSVEEGGE